MTVREQAAFAAGIETARQMVLAAALTFEARDDAGAVRQQAAAAALQGLAAGLRNAFFDKAESDPIRGDPRARAPVSGKSGKSVELPRSGGRLVPQLRRHCLKPAAVLDEPPTHPAESDCLRSM